MTEPLVTVFTPCYNHEPYLDEYCAGLLAQSYANVQLILIDDGSTDGSWETLQRHAPALRRKLAEVILAPVERSRVAKIRRAPRSSRGRSPSAPDAARSLLPWARNRRPSRSADHQPALTSGVVLRALARLQAAAAAFRFDPGEAEPLGEVAIA